MDANNFKYIVIVIICLFVILHKSFNIRIILALISAFVIIFYIKYFYNKKPPTEIKNYPSLEFIKDEELSNFMYNIEDIFMYNPLEYENLIKTLNKFYEYYELAFIDETTANKNYEIMDTYKQNALNILSSIILNTDNQYIRYKINTSAETLNEIMTKHLDQISYLSDNDIYKNGYNINTKIIDYGNTKPYNNYNDMFKNYSYELY